MIAEEERSDAFPAESSVSSESDGHNEGIDLEAREKNLALSNIDEQDVDLSIAFINVHDRVADKTFSEDVADDYRARYRKMHNIVITAHRAERDILRAVKSLHNECLGEQIRLEKARATHDASLEEVRLLEERRDTEASSLQEVERRETALRYEVGELSATADDLNYQLEELHIENSRTVTPELERLREIVDGLKAELERLEKETVKDQALKQSLLEKSEVLEETRKDLGRQQERIQAYLSKTGGEPDRIRKQGDSVHRAAASLDAEVRRLQESTGKAEQDAEKIREKRQQATELKKGLVEKLELQRDTLQHRQKDVEVVTTNLELQRAKNHQLLTERVELTLAGKEADERARREGDTLSMEGKFFELMKRKLRKKRYIADAAKQVVPVLEQQLGDVQADLQSQEGLAKELDHQAEIMRQDVDIGLAKFLSQEMTENSKRSELSTLLEEVDDLEAEVSQWVEEEKRQRKLVALLKGQRDIKQGEASRAQQAEKDTAQQVKMKQLVIADLSKRCNDTNNRLKEFSALYDVVKNERNKYVNLIQASHQALAEMKEKIKILHNEVDILRNESLAKDKALKKERVAHRASQAQRDGLRLEANNASMHYRTKQQVVEQQIVEIEKQNGVINALEREMLRLKAMYEAAVEQRNFAGVQLIDRNDELCVLYEKSNIQETTLKEGSLAIAKREDDIKMLRLQVAELQRRLEAARRRTDQAPDGAENLVKMHEELQTKRAVTEQLSRDLEDPGNLVRWRALEGEDLSMDQLEASIMVLEDRLSDKKEALLEKELVLEEVVSLTKKLRKQATDGRAEALLLSKKVNEFQGRIRDTTRRMMATVSELSMHQATALKLQQEKMARERELQEATWRADHGEPPTEAAVWDLYRIEQKDIAANTQRLDRAEAETAGDMPIPPSMVRTTAEPRPNAYIPDELGIPKPYGGRGPFKPTEGGTTMRHIRMPKPREIEI
ncbi:unnamed protein product, partial [Scytosiphon promiscuus]